MSFQERVCRAAKIEGFKDDYDFFRFYILQGYRLDTILKHLQWVHSIYLSYAGAYKAYGHVYSAFIAERKKMEKKIKKPTSSYRKKYDSKRNRITNCKCPLGYSSVSNAIRYLRGHGLTEEEIARTFGVSVKTFSRLKRQYNISPPVKN